MADSGWDVLAVGAYPIRDPPSTIHINHAPGG
jgi:hypothetical protein